MYVLMFEFNPFPSFLSGGGSDLLYDVKPSWVFALGFKTQLYKRTFLLLGICQVLGFYPGVTGFHLVSTNV